MPHHVRTPPTLHTSNHYFQHSTTATKSEKVLICDFSINLHWMKKFWCNPSSKNRTDRLWSSNSNQDQVQAKLKNCKILLKIKTTHYRISTKGPLAKRYPGLWPPRRRSGVQTSLKVMRVCKLFLLHFPYINIISLKKWSKKLLSAITSLTRLRAGS